jgi:hypothetical protein
VVLFDWVLATNKVSVGELVSALAWQVGGSDRRPSFPE